MEPSQAIDDQSRIQMEASIYDMYADALQQLKQIEFFYQPASASQPTRYVMPGETPDAYQYPEEYQKKFPRWAPMSMSVEYHM